MKKLMIWIGYFFLSLFVFALIYLGADFILSRIPAGSTAHSAQEKATITVYLLSNGVHTDIVLPVREGNIDWRAIFPVTNTRNQDSTQNWIAIGWGDKGFYLNTPEWKDLTLKTALVAGFGVGETALHVTYYKQLSEGAHCRPAMVSSEQYQRLITYILRSLEKDAGNKPIVIDTNAQYGDNDAFYEAEGAYSLFFSCNTWTNKALKFAGMPAGLWTVFDKGILRHY